MTKGEIQILRYLEARERHGNKSGYFRCNQELKHAVKCLKQCSECNEYYEKRVREK